VNRQCENPCRYTQCGTNAQCRVEGHQARCYCPDNYRGNAHIQCTRPECTTNQECPNHLACKNERCEDPCRCAPGAHCRVTNHVPRCSCPPGYIGDPYTTCNVEPVLAPAPECTMDADCASKLACFSGECKNPCRETKPCGANSECTVVDTLPLRTMVCICLPGFVGDADIECRPGEDPIAVLLPLDIDMVLDLTNSVERFFVSDAYTSTHKLLIPITQPNFFDINNSTSNIFIICRLTNEMLILQLKLNYLNFF
jgi:hypothetical protein